MAKGISLHIGLNHVDPKHYQGWDGELNACIADARDMRALAKKRGFVGNTLLIDGQATAEAVSAAILDASKKLSKGDIFLLTYSGHGGQVRDTNGDEKDNDRMDETWVLFDRQLVDDEVYALWSKFKAGVRILVLSDSCHSGTVVKEIPSFMGKGPRPARHAARRRHQSRECQSRALSRHSEPHPRHGKSQSRRQRFAHLGLHG